MNLENLAVVSYLLKKLERSITKDALELNRDGIAALKEAEERRDYRTINELRNEDTLRRAPIIEKLDLVQEIQRLLAVKGDE